MTAARMLTGFCCTALVVSVVAPAALAQTPTATASASPTAESTRRVIERIQEAVRENRQDGPRFIGVLGTITKVGTSTFTLTDVRGLERTIQVAPTTTLLLNGKNAALADLAIAAGAVVMGSAQDEVVVDARRILVQDKDFSETRQTYVGSIQKWDGKMLQLAVRGSQEVQAWNVGRKVVLEDALGNPITTKDIQVDQAAVIITNETAPGKIDVIHLRLMVTLQKTP